MKFGKAKKQLKFFINKIIMENIDDLMSNSEQQRERFLMQVANSYGLDLKIV
jgi:hypothetical protein